MEDLKIAGKLDPQLRVFDLIKNLENKIQKINSFIENKVKNL